MQFIKNLLQKEEEPVKSWSDFWSWFQKHEKKFFRVVKREGEIEKDFFDKLSTKLDEVREGINFLTGMTNEHTAELVFTADGDIRNMVFVEELVNTAPVIKGWMFTAHKQPLDFKEISIQMEDFEFHHENMSFYGNVNPELPDEINLTVVHNDLNDANKSIITNGVHIYLDNTLGELNFATTIDELTVIAKEKAESELIPMEKLRDYLTWREKEFIEKYEGVRHNTDNDNYSMMEATFESGNPLIAMINSDLLAWDSKPSHPWILTIEMKYNGAEKKGLPGDETFQLMNEIEEACLAELKDADGYLNIGRQTAEGVREIYFACKDFRKPSKVLYLVQSNFASRIEIEFEIIKDKYWQSFNRFT